MDFLNNLSPSSQILVSIIAVAILFLLVFVNSKRNTTNQRGRRKRKFGKNLQEKKKR